MAASSTQLDTPRKLQPGTELRWPASVLWRSGEPTVRKITTADVRDALARGFDDFGAMPTHYFFVCLIYPVVGVVLARLAFGYEMLPLIFPMAAGFALLGPVVAVGLYELSRRREQGLDASPVRAFEVVKRPGFGSIILLGIVLTALFLLWLYTANLIYLQTMGRGIPASLDTFFSQVTSTPEGRQLTFVGNVVGFLFAVLVLVTTSVSFPMLVDRNVGAGTAVRTSVRAAVENPLAIALWGLIVAVGLLLGALPLLIGLALVLPILGHATWHLYRKVVAPA